ncbi:MAG: hypothetical protein AB1640_07515 [bacterium]
MTRSDRVLDGRTNVFDHRGEREGYLENDRLDPDRTKIRCE